MFKMSSAVMRKNLKKKGEGKEIITLLTETLHCTIFFIIGFIVGNFLDYGFYRLYIVSTQDKDDEHEIPGPGERKPPSGKDNLGILSGVFIFQIFTLILLFLLIENFSKDTHCQTFLQIGLLSSQIFMIQYTLYVFVKPFSHKGTGKRVIWSHQDKS